MTDSIDVMIKCPECKIECHFSIEKDLKLGSLYNTYTVGERIICRDCGKIIARYKAMDENGIPIS